VRPKPRGRRFGEKPREEGRPSTPTTEAEDKARESTAKGRKSQPSRTTPKKRRQNENNIDVAPLNKEIDERDQNDKGGKGIKNPRGRGLHKDISARGRSNRKKRKERKSLARRIPEHVRGKRKEVKGKGTKRSPQLLTQASRKGHVTTLKHARRSVGRVHERRNPAKLERDIIVHAEKKQES